MINCNIIASGSKGNSIIINDNIMLDCGLSYSKIKDYLKNINIIFISHQHKDHLLSSAIKKIAFEKPNIKFIIGQYLVEMLLNCGVKKTNIIVIDIEKWYDIGIFKVKLDYLIHDVPNCAIHIEFKNKEKLLYATDTSDMEHIIAKEYNLYLIEANYLTNEEIEEKIKIAKENNEFCYLERVVNTHLSQLQAINWLDKNKSIDSKYIFIHEHTKK